MLILFNNSFPRLIMSWERLIKSLERLIMSWERLIKSSERVIMSWERLIKSSERLIKSSERLIKSWERVILCRRNDLVCRRDELLMLVLKFSRSPYFDNHLSVGAKRVIYPRELFNVTAEHDLKLLFQCFKGSKAPAACRHHALDCYRVNRVEG